MPTTFTGPMIMNTAVSLQVWAPARRPSAATPIAACAALSLASAPTTRSPTPVGPLHGTRRLPTAASVGEKSRSSIAPVAVSHSPGRATIGQVRLVHPSLQHQPARVHQKVPFAVVYLLCAVVAADPPFSVLLTDWLSTMAALGVASRAAFRRVRSRSVLWILSQVPLIRHTLK